MAHGLCLFTSSVTLRLVTAYVALPQVGRKPNVSETASLHQRNCMLMS